MNSVSILWAILISITYGVIACSTSDRSTVRSDEESDSDKGSEISESLVIGTKDQSAYTVEDRFAFSLKQTDDNSLIPFTSVELAVLASSDNKAVLSESDSEEGIYLSAPIQFSWRGVIVGDADEIHCFIEKINLFSPEPIATTCDRREPTRSAVSDNTRKEPARQTSAPTAEPDVTVTSPSTTENPKDTAQPKSSVPAASNQSPDQPLTTNSGKKLEVVLPKVSD